MCEGYSSCTQSFSLFYEGYTFRPRPPPPRPSLSNQLLYSLSVSASVCLYLSCPAPSLSSFSFTYTPLLFSSHAYTIRAYVFAVSVKFHSPNSFIPHLAQLSHALAHIHLSILMFATSNLFSSCFFEARVRDL